MAFLVSFFTIFTSPFYFSAAFDLSNFESLFSAITSTIFLQDHQNSIIDSIQLVKLMVPTNALGSSQYGSYLHVGTLISALQSHALAHPQTFVSHLGQLLRQLDTLCNVLLVSTACTPQPKAQSERHNPQHLHRMLGSLAGFLSCPIACRSVFNIDTDILCIQKDSDEEVESWLFHFQRLDPNLTADRHFVLLFILTSFSSHQSVISMLNSPMWPSYPPTLPAPIASTTTGPASIMSDRNCGRCLSSYEC